MVVQVQKIGEDFVLPPEAVKELGLVDGSVVDIQPVENAVSQPQIRYASKEEVFESFERTLPQHEAAYRELAK